MVPLVMVVCGAVGLTLLFGAILAFASDGTAAPSLRRRVPSAWADAATAHGLAAAEGHGDPFHHSGSLNSLPAMLEKVGQDDLHAVARLTVRGLPDRLALRRMEAWDTPLDGAFPSGDRAFDREFSVAGEVVEAGLLLDDEARRALRSLDQVRVELHAGVLVVERGTFQDDEAAAHVLAAGELLTRVLGRELDTTVPALVQVVRRAQPGLARAAFARLGRDAPDDPRVRALAEDLVLEPKGWLRVEAARRLDRPDVLARIARDRRDAPEVSAEALRALVAGGDATGRHLSEVLPRVLDALSGSGGLLAPLPLALAEAAGSAAGRVVSDRLVEAIRSGVVRHEAAGTWTREPAVFVALLAALEVHGQVDEALLAEVFDQGKLDATSLRAAVACAGRVGGPALVEPLMILRSQRDDPRLAEAARESIAMIQDRLHGVDAGRVSLASATEAGQLSLRPGEQGAVSLPAREPER